MTDLFEIAKDLVREQGSSALESNRFMRNAILELLDAFDKEDPYHVQLLTDEFHEKVRQLRRAIA